MAPQLTTSPATCSAPGKLFLFGEYAVLRGGLAIVTAVNRRVFATRHVEATTYRAHGTEGLALPRFVLETTGSTASVEHLETDVRPFFDGPNKLGLGSSAASSVALCAAVLAYDAEGALDRDAVFRAAFDAHRLLQNGRGSGGDVACATYGGTLVYSMNAPWRPLNTPPIAPPIVIRAVWTGESASSTRLVGRVEEALASHPRETEQALANIAGIAERATALIDAGAWTDLVELFSLGDEAMERLGEVSGAPIITDRHRALRELATSYGLFVKPSGAGGGDFSLVVGEASTDTVDWEDFARHLPAPCKLVDLEFGVEGVRVESIEPQGESTWNS